MQPSLKTFWIHCIYVLSLKSENDYYECYIWTILSNRVLPSTRNNLSHISTNGSIPQVSPHPLQSETIQSRMEQDEVSPWQGSSSSGLAVEHSESSKIALVPFSTLKQVTVRFRTPSPQRAEHPLHGPAWNCWEYKPQMITLILEDKIAIKNRMTGRLFSFLKYFEFL